MSINSVGVINTATVAAATSTPKTAKAEPKKETFDDTAAVYEKSSDKADRSAIVKSLQADAEARSQQLMDIVRQSMTGQASKFNQANGLKSLFENLVVDADTVAKAQADIADDGYWGVDKTSERILDFAKALSGDDPEKGQKLLDAFKKGFDQATKAWGGKLPDLCQRTYDAVVDKFNNWMGVEK